VTEPSSPVSRGRLLAFLGAATFFEGFDVSAMAQVLPQLGQPGGLGLSESGKGWLVGAVGVGPMLSWFLVREADRFGRRPVMGLTLMGYALATLLSGLAPNAWVFGAFQVLARACLVGEWALAMIYAAEEFPAQERARVMGILHGLAWFGGLTCVALVPWLTSTKLGWRAVFVVGVIPVLLLAVVRRSLPETARFRSGVVKREAASAGGVLAIWRSAWAPRLWVASLASALTYVCIGPVVQFFKQYAVSERGFTSSGFAVASSLAAVVSLPLVFLSGRFIELLGRRRAAAVLFPLCAVSVAAGFTLTHHWVLVVTMALTFFASAAVVPLLNTWTTELFPTHLRGSAFAWSNALLGRVGSVVAPVLMGYAAERVGWGLPVALSALGPLLAGLLLWRAFPETTGRELEATSVVDEAEPRVSA
jgi:putative MFS transporter